MKAPIAASQRDVAAELVGPEVLKPGEIDVAGSKDGNYYVHLRLNDTSLFPQADSRRIDLCTCTAVCE